MKALVAYGVGSAGILAVLALLVSLGLGVEGRAAWVAAGIAWPVQLAAFVMLLAGREGSRFMLAWLGGMALRFAAVGVSAVWVTRVDGPDPASLLLSLVGFVFVLVLLEPLFLRLKN